VVCPPPKPCSVRGHDGVAGSTMAAFDVGDALRGRLKQGSEQRLLILVS
jgi:hypothetical protein